MFQFFFTHSSLPTAPVAIQAAKKEDESNKDNNNESKPCQSSKEVQVQKPMYDGYLIAPGAFDQLLDNVNEKISATNAQAHYNSTQHLRDAERQQQQQQQKTNKKSTYTSTDGLSNHNPISPDILFKLHFDAKRKDRQSRNEEDEESKDFVNVADLDGNACDDLLKLIEREQSKRQGKFVSITKKPDVVTDDRHVKKASDAEDAEKKKQEDEDEEEKEPIRYVL